MGYPDDMLTPEALVPESNQFTYMNVDEFITTPDITELARTLDPEYMRAIDDLANVSNQFSIPAYGNINQPSPTTATTTFDPLKQQSPPDLSTPEGTLRAYSDISKITPEALPEKDPIISSIANSNFERYYNHPKFAELGFHPYRDNESYYNANSTWWDDASRMVWQLFGLSKTGLVSPYRSWGDFLGTDPYNTTDLESSREFSKAMRIGNSSREGVGHFINNLLLQSGYTMGIIGSVALEEFALFGISAATGGALAPAAGVKTASNIAKVGRSVANLFNFKRYAAATRVMLDAFKNPTKAKSFFDAIKRGGATGGKALGEIFTPETMYAFGRLNTTQNATQNLSNFAKMSTMFGGFYRDIRGLNYAISEAKMEAGMVYDQQLANGYAAKSIENHGNPLTDEQTTSVLNAANEAAFYTAIGNTPVIYLTNQLTLGNAFGAYRKSLSRMINDGLTGVPKRMIKGKKFIDDAGKAATDIFVDAGKGYKSFFKRVKAKGLTEGTGSAVRTSVGLSLRYFSMNVGEGLQEVYQEALAHGVKHYHQKMLMDPAAIAADVWKNSVASAIDSQFSSQGFETFMSGFLMGGVVQIPQKIIFQGIPGLKNKAFNSEALEQYKKDEDAYVKAHVDAYNAWGNKIANKLNLMIDPVRENLVVQQDAAISMMQAALDQSQYDFADAGFLSEFQNGFTILSQGNAPIFINQLEDYLKLSDEDLIHALSQAVKPDEATAPRLRDKINSQIKYIKQLEKTIENKKDQYPNIFDETIHPKGTRQYADEWIDRISLDYARYLAIFTEESFKNNLKRINSIAANLESESLFEGMAANDITVLLSRRSLLKELLLLKKGIDVRLGSEDEEVKKLVEKDLAKQAHLKRIFIILYSKENQKDGQFDSSKINEFNDAFKEYISALTGEEIVFVDEGKMEDTLIKIIDYIKLGERGHAYAKSIEYLNNPARFNEIRERQKEYFKDYYLNKFDIFKTQVEKHVKNTNINQALSAFIEINVLPDGKEAADFINTGDIFHLKTFGTEDGEVTKASHPEKYKRILEIKNVYNAATANQRERDKKEDAKRKKKETGEKDFSKVQGQSKDINDLLIKHGKIGPDSIIHGTTPELSPFIKALLQRKFDARASFFFKRTGLSLHQSRWLKGKDAIKYKTAYNALKKIWYNHLIESGMKEGDALTKKFKEDNGFEEWLKGQKDNEVVLDVLQDGDIQLNFGDFFPSRGRSEVKTPDFEKDVENIKYTGETFYVVKKIILPRNPDDKPAVVWQIKNIQTGDLSDSFREEKGLNPNATYLTERKAKDAAIELEGSEIKSFTFDGVELYEGATVLDKKNQKYIVINDELKAGEPLLLLPEDQFKESKTKEQRKTNAIKIKKGKFKDDYALNKLQFIEISDDVTKLNKDEPINSTPHIYDDETNKSAWGRVQVILQNLSPLERLDLEIRIEREEHANQSKGEKLKYEEKEENPFIDKMVSPFSVAIRITDLEVIRRINNRIKIRNKSLEKGEQITELKQDGIFAYIPTGSIQILNQQFKPIDPIEISIEDIKNTIARTKNISVIGAEEIRERFRIQEAFVEVLERTMQVEVEVESAEAKTKSRPYTKKEIDKATANHQEEIDFLEKLQKLTGVDISDEAFNILFEMYTSAGKMDLKIPANFAKYKELSEMVEHFNDVYSYIFEAQGGDPTTTLSSIISEWYEDIRLLPTQKKRISKTELAALEKSTEELEGISTTGTRVVIKWNPETNAYHQVKSDGKLYTREFKGNVLKKEKEIDTQKLPSLELTLKELRNKGFNLILKPGFFNFDSPKKVTDLVEYKVDGHVVIMTNTFVDGVIVTTFDTDIANIDEKNKFLNRVEDEFKSYGDAYISAQQSQRYIILIKSPNEVYTYAPLQPTKLTDKELFAIFEEALGQAIFTIKNNLTEKEVDSKQKVIDQDFNNKDEDEDAWTNNRFNQKFYIAALPGISINLNVTSGGNIAIEVYDRDIKKQLIPLALIKIDRGQVEKLQKDLEEKGEEKLELLDDFLMLINQALKSQKSRELKEFRESDIKYKKLSDAQLKKEFKAKHGDLKLKAVELNRGSFRRSFEKEVPVETIVDNTTTTLEEGVRSNRRLHLDANENAFKEDLIFTAKEFFKEAPVVEEEEKEEEIIKNELAGADVGDGTLQEELNKELENLYDKYIDDIESYYAAAETKISKKIFILSGMDPESGNAYIKAYVEEGIIFEKDIKRFLTLFDIYEEGFVKETEEAEKIEEETIDQKIKEVQKAIIDREDGIIKRTDINNKEKRLLRKGGDPEIKKLKDELNILINKRSAFKIITENFSQKDVEDINIFKEWAEANTPDFITIEDINTLAKNLKINGIRAGQFSMSLHSIGGKLKEKGVIYVGAANPGKYHEGFHSVFRMLLTNEQIKEYLRLAKDEVKAKYGEKFEEELEKFKNLNDDYKDLSRKELEDEFYEDHMANEFDKFKMNPRSTKTNSKIKAFFNKIIAWFKSVFTRYTKNELLTLYENIDAGKYKAASIQPNRFINSLDKGTTINANIIIPVQQILSDMGNDGYRSLNRNATEKLVRGIAARVLDKEKNNINAIFNYKNVINESIDLYIKLYDPLNPNYDTGGRKSHVGRNPQLYRDIEDRHAALTTYRKHVEAAVEQELNFYDIKVRSIEEEFDEIEQLTGKTTQEYDKDGSQIGGTSSVSASIRKYLGTTQITDQDEFENKYLIEVRNEKGNIIEEKSERLLINVDFAEGYNGILKAVQSITDPVVLLQQLYLFSRSKKNVHTRAIVDRIFSDLGIRWDRLKKGLLPLKIKDPFLFQRLIKGFENFRIDYIFIHRIAGGKIYTYDAANRDDAHTQIDRWAEANRLLREELINYPTRKAATVRGLTNFMKHLDTQDKLSDKSLDDLVNKYVSLLKNKLGIDLSQAYLKYSIISVLTNKTSEQTAIFNAYKNVIPIVKEDIVQIHAITTSDNNIFSDTNTGMKSRIKKIALNNAPFDETVGASVFKNPNGDLVFAHQLPTLHLRRIAGLNDRAKLAVLKSDPFLIKNFLLNSAGFNQLSEDNLLKIIRLSGSKESQIDFDEVGGFTEMYKTSKGKTYKDFTPRELIISLINAYTHNINSKTGEIKNTIIVNGKETALAPILIRVLEASSTADMLPLTILNAVKKLADGRTEVTDIVLDSIINNVEAAFKRIQKENILEEATYQKNTEGEERGLVLGYNAIEKKEKGTNIIQYDEDKTGRAFKLGKAGIILKPSTTKIEEKGKALPMKTSQIQLENIASGRQKIMTYNTQAAGFINFAYADTVKDVSIEAYEKKEEEKKEVTPEDLTVEEVKPKKITKRIKGRGPIAINESNKGFFINQFLESGLIIEGKVPDGEKNALPLRKYETVSYYTYNSDIKKFFDSSKYKEEDKFKLNIYDILEEKEVEEVEEGEEVEEVESYTEKLERLANENPTLDFEKALAKEKITINQLKEYISERLNEEFAAFRQAVDNVKRPGDFNAYIKKKITTINGKTNAETKKAMRLLNLKVDEIDYNLKQIFFNDWVNTTAINQLLLGDIALSLKDAVDEVKRAKMQNASYYSAASIIAAPDYGIMKAVQEFHAFALTEPFARSSFLDEDENLIKYADSQLWLTVKAFKHFWFGFGQLTKAQSELLDKIERGEKIKAEEIYGIPGVSKGHAGKSEMINSKKLVYGDGKVFLKMSAFVLSKALTSKLEDGKWVAKDNKPHLHNLRVKMEAFEHKYDTITVAAPISAFKMLKKNISNINTVLSSSGEFTKNDAIKLDANLLGLQTINPSNKLIITEPTQIKTIVTSEQSDDTLIWLPGENEPIELGEIRRLYHKAKGNTVKLNWNNKRNLIYSRKEKKKTKKEETTKFVFDIDYAMQEFDKSLKANELTEDLYTYLKYAETILGSIGASSNLIEYFSIDEEGGQKYELNNPQIEDKFIQLFLAYFSKQVFNEKIPGITAALLADLGIRVFRRVFSVDENGMPDKHEIIRERVWENNYKSGDIQMSIDGKEGDIIGDDSNLKQLKERIKHSKKGKGVIIVDRLRANLNDYKKIGDVKDWQLLKSKYTEAVLPAHFADVMNLIEDQDVDIPDVIAKMFAVRIPSQDKHSAVNIRQVDFLPVFYGSTIATARELVEISGADFDIDKLYIHIKEWYLKEINGKKEFIEYGASKDENQLYKDYVKYVNTNVTKVKSVYKEALDKYKVGKRSLNPKFTPTDKDIKKLVKKGLSLNSIIALSMLAMPRSFDEYKAFKAKYDHEPYTAPLNNKALDYKAALISNEYVTERLPLYIDEYGNETIRKTKVKALDDNGNQKTRIPIAYEPANTKPLESLVEEIFEVLPELKEALREDSIDVDNLLGKLKSFVNVKEGTRSIGWVVIPNTYFSLLREYNASIRSEKIRGREIVDRLSFGGIFYDTYNIVEEKLEKGSLKKTPDRTQYLLSALITAMTDAAKDRLPAKLGLTKNALSILANMVALGVPLKTAALIINQPVMRHMFYEMENAPEESFISLKSLIRDRIGLLVKAFGEEVKEEVVVNQENLIKHAQYSFEEDMREKSYHKATDSQYKKLMEDGEVTLDIAKLEYSILKQLNIANEIAQYTRHIGTVLGLLGGLGKDVEQIYKIQNAIEVLGLNLNDTEYKASKPLINVKKIFKDTLHGEYLRIFNELTNVILPKTVLRFHPEFQSLLKFVTANIGFLKTKDRIKIEKDFLSYITIKAYEHIGGTQNKMIATSIKGSLTNDLIYDNPNSKVDKITDIIERLRVDPKGKGNFFLNWYVIALKTLEEGNKDGVNTIGANTFNRISSRNKINLQVSFAELWTDPQLKDDMRGIVHYMMVKDGLQYSYRTLTDAISPFVLDSYLTYIKSVRGLFDSPKDSSFKGVFDLSRDELIKDFLEGYLTSARNLHLVPELRRIPKYKILEGIELTSRRYNIKTVAQNKDTIYVFGDDLTEVNRSGNAVVRDQDNTLRLIYKKELGGDAGAIESKEEGERIFWKEGEEEIYKSLIDDFVKKLDAYKETGMKIVFPQFLMERTERENFKKHSPEAYKYFKDVLKKKYDYGIEKNPAKGALKKPLYMDESGDVNELVFNLYNGVLKIDDSKKRYGYEGYNFLGRGTKTGLDSKKRKKAQDTLRENIKLINENRNLKVEYTTISKATGYIAESKLPYVVKYNTAGAREKAKYILFLLDEDSVKSYYDRKIDDYTPIMQGSYAKWKEVDIMGTFRQWGGGFMHGPRLPLREVQKYIEEANKLDKKIIRNKRKKHAISVKRENSILNLTSSEPDLTKGEGPNFDVKGQDKPPVLIDMSDIFKYVGKGKGKEEKKEEGKEDTSELTKWWDENIQSSTNPKANENAKKLRENVKPPIRSLEELIKDFENNNYSIKEYIDQLQKCYLK